MGFPVQTGTDNVHALVRACSRGDRKAEEQVFAVLYKFVHATLNRRWRETLGMEETEDVLLQCMEKLLAICRSPEKADAALENGRFLGYVHSMAENAALDHYRSRQRKSKVFLRVSDDSEEETNGIENLPSGEADITEVILSGMASRRALRQLDEKQRRVIELRMNGAEYEEISAELAISQANARQIHKRGIRSLREKLILEHESLLFSLPVSQAEVLRRLYLKGQGKPGSRDITTRKGTGELPISEVPKQATQEVETSEEEALQAFYTLIVERGLFLWLVVLVKAAEQCFRA